MTSLPVCATVEVHLRVAAGASLARQCAFCADGLTLVNGERAPRRRTHCFLRTPAH